MDSTNSIISAEDVDLNEIDSLLRYLAIGFSLASGFQVVKSRRSSSIPKSEANALRDEFSTMFGGKQKQYLRKRIPLLLIGLIRFGVDKSEAVGFAKRISDFKSLIRKYDENSISPEERTILTEMSESLSRPYYSNTLNASLDPISGFFAGKAPGSFSNALSEFADTLEAPSVLRVDDDEEEDPRPVIRIVEEEEDPERTIKIIESPEEDVPAVREVLPEFEILEDAELKEEDVKKTQPEPKGTKSSTLKYAAIGAGIVGTVVVVSLMSRNRNAI